MNETPYTFLVTKLTTGQIIDEVELQSFHWNELYNRPGAAEGTVRIDDRTATRTNFDSWANGLWVKQGDAIVWGGFMGAVTPISGSRVLHVPVKGFEDYFRSRFIRSAQGMTYATTQFNAIKWTNVDVFRVAKDLIDHAQSFATGNLGVNVEWAALSGNLVTQTYYGYEYKPVGIAFEQLADNINGFDWRYRFDYNGSNPRCNIVLSPIPQGRRTGFMLEYDHNPGKKNILSFDTEVGATPMNGVAAIGSGEGESMLRTYVSDLSTGYPLYEDIVSYKDVTQLTTLAGHANKHLNRFKKPIEALSIKIDPTLEPRFTEFICGDQMRVKVNDGWMQYDAWYIVKSKSMVLSKEMDLELTVGLELVQ